MFKFILIGIPTLIIGLLIFLAIDNSKQNKKRKIENRKKFLSEKYIEDSLNSAYPSSSSLLTNDLKEFWRRKLELAEKRQKYIEYYLYCVDYNIKVPKTYYCKDNTISSFNKADVLKVLRLNDKYIYNIKTLSLYDLAHLEFFTADKSKFKDDWDKLLSPYVVDYEIELALGIFKTLKKFYNDSHKIH